MPRFLIPVLVIIVAVVVFMFVRQKPLICGVAENMLVCPNRPSIAVKPAPSFFLIDARRADAVPPSTDGPMISENGNAELYYALYENSQSSTANLANESHDKSGVSTTENNAYSSANKKIPSKIVVLLGRIDTPYRWVNDANAPAPKDDRLFPDLWREIHYTLKNHSVSAVTFIAQPNADPWSKGTALGSENVGNSDAPLWKQGSLVRRFAFALFQDNVRLVVEYHEPMAMLQPDLRQKLSDFEKRAELAFDLLSENLPRPEKNLEYPPKNVSRKALAAYIGQIRRFEDRK